MCKLDMRLQWLGYGIDAIAVVYVCVDEYSREWPTVEREMLVGMKPSRSPDRAPREGGTITTEAKQARI